jgi:alpha-1,6-mannosyltransferase
MISGTPIQEDDPYRYLWDGALVAHGLDPYRQAPGAFQGNPSGDPSLAARLAEQSDGVLERVNYPWLRTLYPTLAQAAFGFAHGLAPWSLSAWRGVVAAFDLVTFYMLCRLGVPVAGLLIYGWNPLLIKEVYNSAHVDALLLPFLLAAVTCLQRERPIAATAAVGVASCIKLWPVLLMPIAWRRLTRRPRVLLCSLLLSAGALAVALLPVVLSGMDRSSGLAAYARYWEMNDALFVLISWFSHAVAYRMTLSPDLAALMPRVAAAVVAAGGIGWLAWRRDLMVGPQLLAATTLLILLSPTQFPWYYLWLLPFLALHPHPALILCAALLPMYYLRPLMAFHGYAAAFDYGVVWIQHGPVIAWLFRDWLVRGGLGQAGRSVAEGTQRPAPGSLR